MENGYLMSVGPIALVGSGEYLPVMQPLETKLISGRNPKYVQIPIASAPEGETSLKHWVSLGKEQADRIGVESLSVIAHNREDADNPEIAQQVRGAGLIYLSGGNPTFLANTLRGTLLWHEIKQAWENGAALAGCSAGAMVLTEQFTVPTLKFPTVQGVGLLPHLKVIPHFDRFFAKMPDFVSKFIKSPKGVTLLGIDEETAVVGGPLEWEVYGRQSAWLFVDGVKKEFRAGSTFFTPGLQN